MKPHKCSTKVLARMREHYKATPFWRKAEKQIAMRLRQLHIPCVLVAAQGHPFDILTKSGKRVECKAATLLRGRTHARKHRKRATIKSPFWQVSILRHGYLDESEVDFYVIYLTGCPDLRPIYLVVKAPLKRKHIVITLRQLLMRWAGNVNAFHLIREAA